MTSIVTFPGFGLEFQLNRVMAEIFGFSIYWYGAIIALGFVLAVLLCCHLAPKHGLDEGQFLDGVFWAIPLGIVGARIYYILFYLDLFKHSDGSLDFAKMIDIRDGGIAIYGGIIAGALVLMIFCRIRKISFKVFGDVIVYGVILGQLIGRWGNFVNVEAYGGPTDLPWRMGVNNYMGGHMEVHPTFLYESIWNVIGLVLLLVIAKKWRKFDGQILVTYFAWYGFGRAVIEGLRTDSLYVLGTSIRVSQVFGLLSGVVALAYLVYQLGFIKHDTDELAVNQLKLVTEVVEDEEVE